ncbi:MAG: MBL fold metallo-hydrolase [Hyphomicrobiales bacterium]|nr:MBL fold metallo-hydrolase [Hyphomicrobiales bacterium]
MKISFHGADRDVTGSCHLIEAAGKKILVDCGMFQGGATERAENKMDFGFDPDSIDVLVLTHAHLDHCGRIPLLVKRGFRGEIVCTGPTRELSRLVMLDSARLQEEDTHRPMRKARRWEPHGPAEQPLYDVQDAMKALDRFGRLVTVGSTIELVPNVTATFYEAGHILGSTSVLIESKENGSTKRILMSGDLGDPGRSLLNDYAPPAAADAVVMETTYGDRDHKDFNESVEEFYEAIAQIRARGGNIVVPTFALERAQELLFYLKTGIAQNKIPPDLQIFVDSPMAISATDIARNSPDFFRPNIAELLKSGDDPFAPPHLRFTKLSRDSMEINNIKGGALILAGSGMATGGRVLHHLRHNLARPECGVIFVGFASVGTLARKIIDGAKVVQVLEDEVPVRASVHTINGFSGHAGRKSLIAWRAKVNAPKTFLVHGEVAAMQAIAPALPGQPTMPAIGDAAEI